MPDISEKNKKAVWIGGLALLLAALLGAYKIVNHVILGSSARRVPAAQVFAQNKAEDARRLEELRQTLARRARPDYSQGTGSAEGGSGEEAGLAQGFGAGRAGSGRASARGTGAGMAHEGVQGVDNQNLGGSSASGLSGAAALGGPGAGGGALAAASGAAAGDEGSEPKGGPGFSASRRQAGRTANARAGQGNRRGLKNGGYRGGLGSGSSGSRSSSFAAGVSLDGENGSGINTGGAGAGGPGTGKGQTSSSGGGGGGSGGGSGGGGTEDPCAVYSASLTACSDIQTAKISEMQSKIGEFGAAVASKDANCTDKCWCKCGACCQDVDRIERVCGELAALAVEIKQACASIPAECGAGVHTNGEVGENTLKNPQLALCDTSITGLPTSYKFIACHAPYQYVCVGCNPMHHTVAGDVATDLHCLGQCGTNGKPKECAQDIHTVR